MTGFHTATASELRIPLMQGVSPELMQVNARDDIRRWWEVMDRTEGTVVDTAQWSYADGAVTIHGAKPYHEYTVSFLCYLIWDPVHMYNAIVNGWKDVEHQITFDVRQPKTHAFSLKRLRAFLESHPYVNVVRYTTFFHQFTLVFDELKRQKYVDWYGYSASVSPSFSSGLKRKWAIPSGLSISSIRATTTTSIACPAGNTWTSRLSSGARSQHWPGSSWTSPTSMDAKP